MVPENIDGLENAPFQGDSAGMVTYDMYRNSPKLQVCLNG